MAMRKYVPNDRDREIVLRMAAIPNVDLEAVAFCITNPRTNKAINRRTLEKHYAKEIATARGVMANMVMKSFAEMIAERNWPAVKMGLSNYCGLRDNGEIVANVTTNVERGIEVRFVPSPYANEPIPAVDSYDMDLPAKSEPVLLPAWKQQDAQVQEAAKPAETTPEPMRLSDLPKPTAKAKRQALQERGVAEGWSSSVPRASAFGGAKGWMR